MEYKFQLHKNVEDATFHLLAKPEFLLEKVLGAEVKFIDKKYVANVPLSALFLSFNLVLQGHVYGSSRTIIYAFVIPDFAKHRDGIIRIERRSYLTFHIRMDLPLNWLYSISLKKRIEKFRENFDEIIRLERIKRKV